MFNLNLFLKSEEIQSGKEPMDLFVKPQLKTMGLVHETAQQHITKRVMKKYICKLPSYCEHNILC